MNKKTISECDCGGSLSSSTFNPERAINNILEEQSRALDELLTALQESNAQRSTRGARAVSALERIIGGKRSEPGTFQDCCLIGDVGDAGLLKSWYCTGSLIHPSIVLTARHCISSRNPGGLSPNAIAIGINSARDVRRENIHRVSSIVSHPSQDATLLFLRKPVDGIEPSTIASEAQMHSAQRCLPVGFGNSNPNGTMGFGIKRQVEVDIAVMRRASNEDLMTEEQILGFNSRFEFVAGRKGSGKDSCNGDSGGPIYVPAEENSTDWDSRVLAGLTSRATDEAIDNCGDGGVYVRADTLLPWMREQAKQLIGETV